MSVVAVVPARGGSVRIKRKNIRDFRGKPMMQWPIEAARYSDLFDEIVVSTDDEEIEDYAQDMGCSIYSRALDDGLRGTQEVAAEVLRDERYSAAKFACVIYPCSPMLRFQDLRSAWDWMRAGENLFAMSVLTDPLADAGMFYFGRADAFRNGAPLIHQHTVMIPIPPERGIDINTFEDLAKAEAMFDRLREHDKLREGT